MLIVQCRAYKDDIELARMCDMEGCAIYLAVTQEHREDKLHGLGINQLIEKFVSCLDLLKSYGFKYRRAVLEDSQRFFSAHSLKEDTFDNFKRIVESVDMLVQQ